ncbi:MAG: hypothetical protein Q4A66_11080 [Eubacteriales bacterium]|nr:hypothetical protein [Eubacteriales bacterium]
MNRFYSTCAAGLEGVANGLARSAIRSYGSERVLTGALLYDAAEDLPRLPLFQNTYLVLAEYRASDGMDKAALRVLRDRQALQNAQAAIKTRRFRSFRYMFSDQNKLAAVNGGTRAQLEKAVSGAQVDRVSPETELLILRRSEGLILFLLRLTRREGTEKTLARGELSPAVASAMAYLVQPSPEGVFCDPFSGHGAIAQARLALAPAKKLYLFDTDPEMIAVMQGKKALRRPHVEIAAVDAMRLGERIPAGSITELAADPPWGLFSPLPEPAPVFYRRMLEQFAVVLAPAGRLCVLTADKTSFEEAAALCPQLAFEPRVDLLVNGKKAALYPGRRL